MVSYVYIMKCKNTKFYKIGVSNDPKKRLNTIQGCNPHKIIIKYSEKFNLKSFAFGVEKEVKNEFKSRKLQTKGGTEWFNLGLDDFKWAKDYINFSAKEDNFNSSFVDMQDVYNPHTNSLEKFPIITNHPKRWGRYIT